MEEQTKMLPIEILRTRFMTDFENDPDAEGLHHEVNRERTKEL